MQDVSELFRQYRDDVCRLAVSYTHSREEAEDVCQTVFLKLMGGILNTIQPYSIYNPTLNYPSSDMDGRTVLYKALDTFP